MYDVVALHAQTNANTIAISKFAYLACFAWHSGREDLNAWLSGDVQVDVVHVERIGSNFLRCKINKQTHKIQTMTFLDIRPRGNNKVCYYLYIHVHN